MCQKFADRLKALHFAISHSGCDLVIIPNSDPHQSEYLCRHDQFVQWLTGFTGSNATLLATAEYIGLWTDSRYTLQAESELSDLSIEIHQVGPPGYNTPLSWILSNASQYKVVKVGLDGRLFNHRLITSWSTEFEKLNIELVDDIEIASQIMNDRVPLPQDKIFIHNKEFEGRSKSTKLRELRKLMSDQAITHYLVTALDEIAWLLNLRGFDYEYSPVFRAYCIVSQNEVILFINKSKVDRATTAFLSESKIRLEEYQAIYDWDWSQYTSLKLCVDPGVINHRLYQSIPSQLTQEFNSPIATLKSAKSAEEIAHIKSAMIKDGVALAKAFYWLEENVESNQIDEVDFSRVLTDQRSLRKNFHGNSFEPIVGFQGNGAIVHYRPIKESCSLIQSNGILLCDSGGQYHDGTTDITRTITLGHATPHVKKCFTLVLKGLISLSTAQFPIGTSGKHLDSMARRHLWKHGLNYGHGTGHGVGYFLNVHEGPLSISPRSSDKVLLEPGMITSIEPGYYEKNEFGIRIENLVVVRESDQDGFLKFETLTLFPVDRNLIDPSLITLDEIDWLNEYHEMVRRSLSSNLNEKEQEWLTTKCSPIFSS